MQEYACSNALLPLSGSGSEACENERELENVTETVYDVCHKTVFCVEEILNHIAEEETRNHFKLLHNMNEHEIEVHGGKWSYSINAQWKFMDADVSAGYKILGYSKCQGVMWLTCSQLLSVIHCI